MRNPKLKLTTLVLGLEGFGGRYESIRVFADDLLEVRSRSAVAGVRKLDEEGHKFLFVVPSGEHAGKHYQIEILAEAGVVLLYSAAGLLPGAGEASAEGLTGSNVSKALFCAAIWRGEGTEASHVLGLLVGGTLGDSDVPDASRRVFPLRFDASQGRWVPYTGGFVPWLKERLLVQAA